MSDCSLNRSRLPRLAAALLGLALASAAQAGVVTQMGARAGAGTVNWGSEGDVLTNGSAIAPVTVSGSSSTFTVLSGSTFSADFLSGDNVLALYDLASGDLASGSFIIDFASAVYAAGAQVQTNLWGGVSGLIEAFDAANVSLGSFAINGTNAGNGDGSAVFAGIQSDTAEISRLVFSGFGDGAAINQLSYSRESLVGGGGGNVPEPGSLALALLAGSLMLGAGRAARGRNCR